MARGLLGSVPLWWTLGLAALFVGLDPQPLDAAGAGHLMVSGVLAFGFWTLFLALSRELCRKTRWSLLLLKPALLLLVVLAAVQEAHHFLYGDFVDGARLGTAIANREVVLVEAAGLVRALPGWLLPGAALALAGAFLLFVERSRRPLFRPLRGAGGVHAAASLLWVVWWAVPPLHAAWRPSMPDLAGQCLARDLNERIRWTLLFSDEEVFLPRPVGWLLERQGVRPPPPAPHVREAQPRANVLLVLLESVRADHTSIDGYERDTTPNLARWARRDDVVRFPYAFANATYSYFSMLSLTSGLDLRRTAAEFEESPLIWDHLKARGYETFLVTQSLGYPAYGLDRYMRTPGLDDYRDVAQERLAARHADTPPEGVYGRVLRAVLGEWGFEETLIRRDDRLTLDVVRERIRARRGDRPFFGLWELECTHYRYCYPDAFARWQPASPYGFSRRDSEPLMNDYDNALLYVDHVIGQLLAFLEDEGLANDTVVLVASDHGEAFYEHGTVFHGRGFHPEQTRVPFLLRIPGAVRRHFPASALAALEENRDAPVQLADLLPTIVGLADEGAPPSPSLHVDGADLLAPLPERELYITNHPPWRRDANRPRDHARVDSGRTLILGYGDRRPEVRLPLDPPAALAHAQLDEPNRGGANGL